MKALLLLPLGLFSETRPPEAAAPEASSRAAPEAGRSPDWAPDAVDDGAHGPRHEGPQRPHVAAGPNDADGSAAHGAACRHRGCVSTVVAITLEDDREGVS